MSDPTQRQILLVDDRKASAELVASELEGVGHQIEMADDGRSGWQAFCRRRFDLVITDLRMPGTDGVGLLRLIRGQDSPNPGVPVLILSAYGTLSTALAAGRAGATDFFPFNDAGIQELLERVEDLVSGVRPEPPDVLSGYGPAISDARDRTVALANLTAPLLLEGEIGAGQDDVAFYIHRLSRWARGPFRLIHCDATSAWGEQPNSGTVFLRWVNRLPREGQEYWLRQTRAAERSGGTRCRVIASSSESLAGLVAKGEFLADLSQWLCRFTICLPSLRERPEDFQEIADRLLATVAFRLDRPGIRLSPGAAALLQNQPWPENLTSLGHALELMVAVASHDEIPLTVVTRVLRELGDPLSRIGVERAQDERALLLDLYRRHGSFSGVARELGITRNGAKYRFRKYNLIPAHASQWAGSNRDS